MKKILLMLISVVFLTACLESEREYTINPDGSGKVMHKFIASSNDFSLSSQGSSKKEDKSISIIKDEIKKSVGIDTWKDIEVSKLEDGRYSFKGIAYFKDYNQLKLHSTGFDFPLSNFTMTKKENSIEIESVDEKSKDKNKAGFSVNGKTNKSIEDQRKQYNSMKPLLSGALSTMKMDYKFKLPGKLKSVSNLEDNKNGIVQFGIDGKKLFAVLDEVMNDDELIKNIDQEDPKSKQIFNEKLLGNKGPVKAVFEGPFNDLFDYKSEVAAAKNSYPKMLDNLELTGILPQPKSTGGGFKSIKVVGFQSSQDTGYKELRPFNDEPGIKVSILAEFSGCYYSLQRRQANFGDN